MQALGQNIAIGVVLFFLATMVLRQIPVIGFFVRLLTRLIFLFSPVMLIVLLVGLIWFHGQNMFSSTDRSAASVAPAGTVVAPVDAPLPPEAPR